MLDAWRAARRTDRPAGHDGQRLLSLDSLRWIVRQRAITPWYLVHYARFLRFKLRNPHVITHGLVFLGRRVEVQARPGYGRLILGRFVHVGDGTSLRCHEGTLQIGDKVVFGRNSVVNTYLDISIGATSIIADMVYISDFDHAFGELDRPIKDQGINKSPVIIGSDVWLGTKVTVVRGARIGDGCVIGANAVVTSEVPAYSVAVGAPARVQRNRREVQTATDAETADALPAAPAGPPAGTTPALPPAALASATGTLGVNGGFELDGQ